MSSTQIIVMAIFGIFGIIAVLMFSGIIPGFGPGGGGQVITPVVSIWGFFDSANLRDTIDDLNNKNEGVFKIVYTQKNSQTYESEIVDALASGTGPDLWFISQDTLLKNRNKLYLISFASYPKKNFFATFIDGSEVFIDEKEQGIWALPFAIDPMVLYWNRDMFSSAAISDYPKYWDEFLVDVGLLTKLDGAGNIIRSGVAMGEYKNIKNAKGILSMLMHQSGNPVIESGTNKVVIDKENTSVIGRPADNALRFFNEFSNLKQVNYSWNRSLSDSDLMFANSSLAMYFGYASELKNILAKNPHLNFSIAEVPQQRDGAIKTTHGKFYGLAISKNTKNIQASSAVLTSMTNKEYSGYFSQILTLAPARRDLLGEGAEDLVTSVIYKSAVMAKTWPEPDQKEASIIFQSMIESTTTGKRLISEAVREASARLKNLLEQ